MPIIYLVSWILLKVLSYVEFERRVITLNYLRNRPPLQISSETEGHSHHIMRK